MSIMVSRKVVSANKLNVVDWDKIVRSVDCHSKGGKFGQLAIYATLLNRF